jgi:hypothetical protein
MSSYTTLSQSVQSKNDDDDDSFKLFEEVINDDKPRIIPKDDPDFLKLLNDFQTPP